MHTTAEVSSVQLIFQPTEYILGQGSLTCSDSPASVKYSDGYLKKTTDETDHESCEAMADDSRFGLRPRRT
jgi:hypothetical protein